MEDTKKVIAQLMNEFVKEEAGNRVTSNNIMALNMKVNMALDGDITMQPPKKTPSKKE
jgi:hypothetical protein